MTQNYKQTKISSLINCCSTTIEYDSPPPDNYHIVMFGDSRIKDWGNPYFGEGITVTNLGIAGETSYQLLCRLDRVIAMKPDVFILQIGVNDIVAISLLPDNLRIKAQAESILNLKRIMTKLSTSKIKTVCCTVIPPIAPSLLKRLIWGQGIEKITEHFNQTLVAEAPDNIYLLNMKAIFFNSTTNTWRKEYSKNTLHWNDSAYKKITEAVNSTILER